MCCTPLFLLKCIFPCWNVDRFKVHKQQFKIYVGLKDNSINAKIHYDCIPIFDLESLFCGKTLLQELKNWKKYKLFIINLQLFNLLIVN